MRLRHLGDTLASGQIAVQGRRSNDLGILGNVTRTIAEQLRRHVGLPRIPYTAPRRTTGANNVYAAALAKMLHTRGLEIPDTRDPQDVTVQEVLQQSMFDRVRKSLFDSWIVLARHLFERTPDGTWEIKDRKATLIRSTRYRRTDTGGVRGP